MNPCVRGVPFGCRQPLKRGPYCMPKHSLCRDKAGVRHLCRLYPAGATRDRAGATEPWRARRDGRAQRLWPPDRFHDPGDTHHIARRTDRGRLYPRASHRGHGAGGRSAGKARRNANSRPPRLHPRCDLSPRVVGGSPRASIVPRHDCGACRTHRDSSGLTTRIRDRGGPARLMPWHMRSATFLARCNRRTG